MSEGKSERRGLLWWIEHENTNAFWSARNPWIVIALAGTAIIVLCMVGMHFWGRASRGGRCDGKYSLLRLSGRTLFCEVKTGRRVAALGVAVLAAFNLLLWGM